MEDIKIGSYIKYLQDSSWTSDKELIGKYFKVVRLPMVVRLGEAIHVIGHDKEEKAVSCSRFLRDKEFEVMPFGWKPSYADSILINYSIC